jgi:hypothetical protein
MRMHDAKKKITSNSKIGDFSGSLQLSLAIPVESGRGEASAPLV